MYKTLFAYIFSFILLITVVVPTYYSIIEDSCESSLIIDIEEDTENNEEAEKTELKIIGFSNEFSSLHTHFSREINNTYQSNQYDSVSKSLESPPPEYC